MRNIIYPIIFRYYLIYLLNFSKNKNLIFLKLFCGYEKKILIKILKYRFSKIKVQKILYPLSKPPPKFGEILVIWGGLDKGFYGNY